MPFDPYMDTGPSDPRTTLLRLALDRGTFDPVRLRSLRDARESEARDRYLNEAAFGGGPEARRQAGILRDVGRDLADDPYTGEAEQQRIGGIQKALDTAATSIRPEVDTAARAGAERNAFAEFLKTRGGKLGEYQASVSPEGVTAQDLASRRKINETLAGQGLLPPSVSGGRTGEGGIPADEDPLAGLSEADAAIVKGLVDYRVPLPSGMALRTPQWKQLLGRAAMLDPNFDVTQYPTRQALRKEFTSGKSGANIQALGTVQDHLDALKAKAAALNNTGLPPVNAFENWFMGSVKGDPRIQGYRFDQKAVADELSAALKQSGSTNAEIEGWMDRLSSSQSPEQFAETFRSANDLIEKRLGEARARYESGLGKPGAFGELLKGLQFRAGRTAAGDDMTDPNRGR